ncbi:MAG: hypothetical protein IJ995_04855 [Clostridia bacterium]|nr:hypothetical protein [Clostridia bacterium]
MEKHEAWKEFIESGSVEAYLRYTALENKKENGYDAQSQRNSAADGADRS